MLFRSGFEEDNGNIVSSTSESRIEPKTVETVKREEEPTTSYTDPLLDLDRESVNIPSFLRSRK